MTEADARAEIARRGIRPTLLARLLGIHASDMSRVLGEKARTPRERERVLGTIERWLASGAARRPRRGRA